MSLSQQRLSVVSAAVFAGNNMLDRRAISCPSTRKLFRCYIREEQLVGKFYGARFIVMFCTATYVRFVEIGTFGVPFFFVYSLASCSASMYVIPLVIR